MSQTWPLEEILGRAADDMLTRADQDALRKAIADKALIVVQRGKYIVNAEGSSHVEIGDRFGSAGLERIERALKAAIEGSVQEPNVFQHLSDLLKNPQRHPNEADFQSGAYYRNADLHQQVEARLAQGRRCLIYGKPGRGKSALSKGIGYDLLKFDPAHEVFYLSAKNNASLSSWIADIRARDSTDVTFIIDDCHRAADAVNGLVDDWFRIKRARLILVSRTIANRLATSGETNYLAELEQESVSIDSVVPDFASLIAAVVAQQGGSSRDPGPLDTVIRRSEGDLFILDYLVKQWLLLPAGAALADVDLRLIGTSLYSRYVPKLTQYPDAIVTIAALSQFEIDVEARFIGSSQVIDSVNENAFVESSTGDGTFVRFFHSTPAKYLVQAARGAGAASFTHGELLRYVASEPSNVLDVFHQLALNDEEGLLSALLGSSETFAILTKMANAAEILGDDEFKSLLRFLTETHAFVRATSTTLPLFSRLKEKAQEWAVFLERRSLSAVTAYLTGMHAIGLSAPDALLAPEALRRHGERSSPSVNLTEVLAFLRAAKEMGATASDLEEFVAGVDLKSLSRRMHGIGFLRIRKDANVIRGLHMTPGTWHDLWAGIDCRALGEEARIHSLAQIRNFLQMSRRADLADEPLRAFVAGLDLASLGERSDPQALNNVRNFLFDAKRGGVTDTDLGVFYRALNWTDLGRAVGEAGERGKALFFDVRMIADSRNKGITRQMARDFVAGIGWERLHSLAQLASPDVLAVLKDLLLRKCAYSNGELVTRGLDLRSCFLWLESFKSRPSADTHRDRGQAYYLRHALNIFRACVRDTRFFDELELKDWNIITRSVFAADPEYFDQTLLPRITSLGRARLSALFRRADPYNLRIFFQRFHPRLGLMPGQFPKDAVLDVDDLIRKLQDSNLETISGLLFDLQTVGLTAESAALAEHIRKNLAQFDAMFEAATLPMLDWFGWNLWQALSIGTQPGIYEHNAYRAAVAAHSSRGGIEKTAALLGIVGCMHICGRSIPQTLRDAIHEGRARQVCRENAIAKNSAFFRALAGLFALQLLCEDRREREFYRGALEETIASLEIRNPNVVALAEDLAARLAD